MSTFDEDTVENWRSRESSFWKNHVLKKRMLMEYKLTFSIKLFNNIIVYLIMNTF